MIHGDGVEVYLKPSRMGAETLRFPELELKSNDGFRKQCYVPVIEEYFQLVVKFSDTFNMFSAECLHIGVDFGQGQYINQKLMPLSVRRSPVTGQQLVHCGFDDVASKQHDLHLLKMKAHEGKMIQPNISHYKTDRSQRDPCVALHAYQGWIMIIAQDRGQYLLSCGEGVAHGQSNAMRKPS